MTDWQSCLTDGRGNLKEIVSGGVAVALSAICLPFVLPALRKVCLPYVPATDTQVANVMRALGERAGRPVAVRLRKAASGLSGTRKLVDIGSGDGRIVLEAAKAGYKAHGVELNPWLVLYSKYRARRLGLSATATFSRADLWKSEMGQYDNVVIFGVEEMMPALEDKLGRELSASSRVVACRFPFPNWRPESDVGDGIDRVWIYKPEKVLVS